MEARRRLLLEMKKQRGTATPDELAELRDTWVKTGDGPGYLYAPAPCATMEEFMAKFGAMTLPTMGELPDVPSL